MLKSNSTLDSLDISSNNVDYEGITALSAALADNTTLRALHIGFAASLLLSSISNRACVLRWIQGAIKK